MKFSKPFGLSPPRRDAIQMSAALWLTTWVAVVGVTIPTGQVVSAGEWATMFGGLTVAAVLSTLLYRTFRLVRGWPVWLAYALLHASVLALAGLHTALDYAGQYAAHRLFANVVLPSTDPRAVAVVVFWYLCLYGLNLALLWIASVNRRSRDEQVRLAEAKAQAIRAELTALHYQLNPHFLLNSLNSVSSLIMTEQYAEADETVLKLAGFLHDVLTMEPTGRVELADELARTRNYLDIQRVRFSDRFTTQIDCPASLAGALVPGLLLQPIVENAVKYAVAPSDEPVTLSVRAASEGPWLLLTVQDNGHGVAPASRGSGIGLANIRSRLESHYGGRASCEAGPTGDGFRVVLRLPLELAARVESGAPMAEGVSRASC